MRELVYYLTTKIKNKNSIFSIERSLDVYVFLMHFFDEFWVSWASPGGVQNRLFRYFFRLFCSPVASELLLGSPGTVSGQYFIDFRLILARFWVDFLSYFLSICCRSVAPLGPILDCFLCTRTLFKYFF